MAELSEFAQAASAAGVEVVDFPDGRLEVRYKGRSMPYRTFDKLRRVTETAVLENKRPGGLLTLIRESQKSEPPGMRTSKGRSVAIRPSICSVSAEPTGLRMSLVEVFQKRSYALCASGKSTHHGWRAIKDS